MESHPATRGRVEGGKGCETLRPPGDGRVSPEGRVCVAGAVRLGLGCCNNLKRSQKPEAGQLLHSVGLSDTPALTRNLRMGELGT